MKAAAPKKGTVTVRSLRVRKEHNTDALMVAGLVHGDEVTIYEKADRLGGQLHLAGAPPGREEFLQLAKDLQSQLVSRGVKIVLNQQVDLPVVEKEKPDAVIVATGAVPIRLPIIVKA